MIARALHQSMARIAPAIFLPALVSALAAWNVQAQASLFVPSPGGPVKVGQGPGQVILADLNGDGNLDLVTQHLLARQVNVLLGDGHGHFAPAPGSPRSFGSMPGAIAVGDLNHDGIPDIVAARADQDSVDVFLGEGTGRFNQAPGSPFIADPAVTARNKRALFLVDLNEDGNLDVITANGLRSGFSVLLGDGHGGFSPGPAERISSEPDSGFHFFAFGDVSGDGHVDALTVISGPPSGTGRGLLVVQYGDGTGAFHASVQLPSPLPANPRTLALGDMNGDQRLDVVLSYDDGKLAVLLNQGDGTFTLAPNPPYDLASHDVGLLVTDLDGDGTLDVIAACGSNLKVLLRKGQRLVPAPGSPYRAGPGAWFTAVGDIDNNGRVDIVSSSFEADVVNVLLGLPRP
jgi:hypothetical protein